MSGVFTDVFYVVELTVEISSACVNHIHFSQASNQKHAQKNIDFETREPEVVKC